MSAASLQDTMILEGEAAAVGVTHSTQTELRRSYTAQHSFHTQHLYLTNWDPDVYFRTERFLMVTFRAQQSKQFHNESPSVSSNHKAWFSLPSCSCTRAHTHTHERVKIRAASSTLNTQRGRREKWRCACIIHGICRKMKWTSFGKLGTFCSNASRPPRGASYYTLPSVQGQNNQNSHSMTSTARKRSTVGFPSG